MVEPSLNLTESCRGGFSASVVEVTILLFSQNFSNSSSMFKWYFSKYVSNIFSFVNLSFLFRRIVRCRSFSFVLSFPILYINWSISKSPDSDSELFHNVSFHSSSCNKSFVAGNFKLASCSGNVPAPTPAELSSLVQSMEPSGVFSGAGSGVDWGWSRLIWG